MGKFIARRLLLLIPILIGLTLLLFFFLRLLPGDPASAILGERATAESLAAVREALGLDRPLWEQYWEYLRGLLTLDLGSSFLSGRDVADDFLQRFPATVELTVAAMTFALVLGIPLGMLTAKRRGTWVDSGGTALSLIGISIPIFFLGLMLKWAFAIQWPVLPDSGRIDLIQYDIERVTNFMLIDTLIARDIGAFFDATQHLILPGIALGTIPLAIIMRVTRASVIDVQNEDYVRTANAKGLPSKTVDGRHVLRNALLPVVTVIGLQLGLLLGGAILTETIFGWGGVGKWIYDAVLNSDYQVIQSGVLLLAVIFILVNLAVDVSYAFLNPRIRYLVSTAATTIGTLKEDRPVGLWTDAFRRMRRSPSAIIGLTLVAFFVAVAVFAPFLAPYDPTAGILSDSHLPPGPEHWFGTNIQGQDVLSRIIYGARMTLGIAVLSVVLGVTVGAFFGSIAGYFRGTIDAVIMRLVDIMLSIPGLLFAIAVVTFLGRGIVQIAVAIAIVNVPIFARLLRASLLSLRESDYVIAARSVGVRGPALLTRHMLPNAIGPLIVQATLALATAVVDAAALGFLGLGPPDPSTPEWGTMLSDSYRYLNQAPYLAFFPGFAIVLSVLGFNLLGDGMREALDPKLRR